MDMEERTRAVLETAAQQALSAVEAAFADPEQFLMKGKDRQGALDTKQLKDTINLLRELSDLIRQFRGEENQGLRVVFEAGEEAWNE